MHVKCNHCGSMTLSVGKCRKCSRKVDIPTPIEVEEHTGYCDICGAVEGECSCCTYCGEGECKCVGEDCGSCEEDCECKLEE